MNPSPQVLIGLLKSSWNFHLENAIEISTSHQLWEWFEDENFGYFAKKWLRKLLENQSKWGILLGFSGISSSFAIQDEAEKEIYIHILD